MLYWTATQRLLLKMRRVLARGQSVADACPQQAERRPCSWKLRIAVVAVGESVQRRSSMAKLKSERHHWWPVCVSRHWVGEDGKTGWLKPDGSTVRIPPARLGVIGNGHLIKLGRNDEDTAWDQSFERVFDSADTAFPDLISWLEGLERSNSPTTTTLA